jgi:O-6-methylguanine DNA methyltransferase
MFSESLSIAKIHNELEKLEKTKPSNHEVTKIILESNLTEFQKQVLLTVCQIPFGQTVSYSRLADLVGKPKATRATASAVALNKNFYNIPCHRVISKSGKIGQYRWGSKLKKVILEWEQNYNSTYN